MTIDEVEKALQSDGHIRYEGELVFYDSYANGYLDCFNLFQAMKKEIIVNVSDKYTNINKDAFNEWMKYKKYKNKGAITKTLKMLNKYDHQTQQEMVDKSIMNEYKGLFEPKQQRSRTYNNVDVAKNWLNENDFHEMCRPKEISNVR